MSFKSIYEKRNNIFVSYVCVIIAIKHSCSFMCHIKSTDKSLQNSRLRRSLCNDSSVLLMWHINSQSCFIPILQSLSTFMKQKHDLWIQGCHKCTLDAVMKARLQATHFRLAHSLKMFLLHMPLPTRRHHTHHS